MTPQEKAHELTNKFYQPITINLNGVGAYNNSNQIWNHATQCAIICVEEILAEMNKLKQYWAKDIIAPERYWNEVLTHLKNKK